MLLPCPSCKKPVFVSGAALAQGRAHTSCGNCASPLVVDGGGSVRVAEQSPVAHEPAASASKPIEMTSNAPAPQSAVAPFELPEAAAPIATPNVATLAPAPTDQSYTASAISTEPRVREPATLVRRQANELAPPGPEEPRVVEPGASRPSEPEPDVQQGAADVEMPPLERENSATKVPIGSVLPPLARLRGTEVVEVGGVADAGVTPEGPEPPEALDLPEAAAPDLEFLSADSTVGAGVAADSDAVPGSVDPTAGDVPAETLEAPRPKQAAAPLPPEYSLSAPVAQRGTLSNPSQTPLAPEGSPPPSPQRPAPPVTPPVTTPVATHVPPPPRKAPVRPSMSRLTTAGIAALVAVLVGVASWAVSSKLMRGGQVAANQAPVSQPDVAEEGDVPASGDPEGSQSGDSGEKELGEEQAEAAKPSAELEAWQERERARARKGLLPRKRPGDEAADSPAAEVPASADGKPRLETKGAETPRVRASQGASDAVEAEKLYRESNRQLKAKKVAIAIKTLQKCLELDPKHGRAYRSLGVAYMLLGREKSAIRAYESFVELLPSHRDAEKVRQIIADFEKRRGS